MNAPRKLTTEEVLANQFRDLVDNVLTTRSELINKFLDPRRDYLVECGHPTTEEITPQHYKFLYERSPIGNRVVGLMPSQCWAELPNLYEDEDIEVETEFELAWKALCQRVKGNSKFKETEGSYGSAIWEVMKRADELSGIGQYGVILVGFDDLREGEGGKSLRDAVDGVEEYFAKDPEDKPSSKKKTPKKKNKKTDVGEGDDEPDTTPKSIFKPKNKVLFLRPFEQELAQITQYETDVNSPRFGRPKEYLLTFNDPNNQPIGGMGISTTQQHVHWTRIVHIVDGKKSSEVFGHPRMRPVYNNIIDLMKLYGGSAEMYWRGAFPGFALETHPQLGGDVVVDTTAIKSQMTDYMNKLQRYIALMGMSAKSLAPQVSDPTAQINVHLDAICIQLGCPKRIFMGSERGELASTQDEGSWTEVVEERQQNHCIPNIVCPTVDLFIAAGALPEPEEGYCCEWEDTETVSELDEATVAGAKTEAMSKYVGGGVDALMAPKDWLTLVLKLTDDEAESVMENAVEHVNEANPEAEDVTVPGQHPKPPVPEPPQLPIKMKDGETLVSPDGSPLPGKTPPKGPIPPQLVKNTNLDSEVLDDEEDFFYPSSDVRNFNPSQPRDNQGRWGSGGSGGVSPNISKTLSVSSFDAFSEAQDKNKFIQEHLTAVARDLGLKTEIKVLSDPEFNAVVVADAARMGASALSVSAAYKAKSDVAHFRSSNISRIKEKGDLRLFLNKGYHELGHAYEAHVLGKTLTGETSQKSYDNSAREDFANTFSSRLGLIRKKNIGETVKSKSALSTEDHLYVGDVSSYAVNAEDAPESTGRPSSANILPDWYTGSTANPVVSDVANFNPSQPRDSHGRFGSGGGSGGGGSTPIDKELQEKLTLVEEAKANKQILWDEMVKKGYPTDADRAFIPIENKKIRDAVKQAMKVRKKIKDTSPGATLEPTKDLSKEFINSQKKNIESSPDFEEGKHLPLLNYTDVFYKEVNSALRTGTVDKLDDFLKKDIKKIDKLFKSAPPLKEELITRRGVGDASQFYNLRAGDRVKDQAFMSTTVSPRVLNRFTDKEGAIFTIKIPKGSKVVYDENEKEVILNRGTGLKVLGTSFVKNQLHVDLEVENE